MALLFVEEERVMVSSRDDAWTGTIVPWGGIARTSFGFHRDVPAQTGADSRVERPEASTLTVPPVATLRLDCSACVFLRIVVILLPLLFHVSIKLSGEISS